jgi:dynactin complex subunit
MILKFLRTHPRFGSFFINNYCSRRKDFLKIFRHLEETANFLKHPDAVQLENRKLKMFDYIYVGNFEM